MCNVGVNNSDPFGGSCPTDTYCCDCFSGSGFHQKKVPCNATLGFENIYVKFGSFGLRPGCRRSLLKPFPTKWDCYSGNIFALLNATHHGTWYSSLDQGYCGAPGAGAACTWRVLRAEVIMRECHTRVFGAEVARTAPDCFDGCGAQRANSSSLCWIDCFYQVARSPPLTYSTCSTYSTDRTLHVHCTYTACTLHIHCMYTAHTLRIHCAYACAASARRRSDRTRASRAERAAACRRMNSSPHGRSPSCPLRRVAARHRRRRCRGPSRSRSRRWSRWFRCNESGSEPPKKTTGRHACERPVCKCVSSRRCACAGLARDDSRATTGH